MRLLKAVSRRRCPWRVEETIGKWYEASVGDGREGELDENGRAQGW